MARLTFTKASASLPCKVKLLSRKPRRDGDTAKATLDEERSAANHQTPEQDKHAEYGIKVTHSGERRAYNLSGTNIDYYLKKNIITVDQHEAAIRLYTDFTNSRMVNGFKSCLDITIGGTNGVNKAGLNFQAYEAYRGAINSIHSRRVQKFINEVCCHGKWVKECKVIGVKPYKLMALFDRALDDLIRYYESRINPRKVMTSFHASMVTTMGPV